MRIAQLRYFQDACAALPVTAVLFFLFWEVELIPMYMLIGIWGSGRKEYSAIKFVIAIGGITEETAYEVIKSGAHGIAVISTVCASPNPEHATRSLLAEIRKGKQDVVI